MCWRYLILLGLLVMLYGSEGAARASPPDSTLHPVVFRIVRVMPWKHYGYHAVYNVQFIAPDGVVWPAHWKWNATDSTHIPHFPLVQEATYRLHYCNFHNQVIEKEVVISAPPGDTVYIDLFADSLPGVTTTSLLALLKEKRRLSIVWNSSGCFHQHNVRLSIESVPRGYRLVLDSIAITSASTKKRSARYTRTVDRKDADTLEQFLAELPLHTRPPTCTTKETYVIQSGEWKSTVDNGSCRWSGMWNILSAYFAEVIEE